MATGDQADIAGRLRAALPRRWFPDTTPGAVSNTPILDGVLAGLANAWAWVFSFVQYAKLQMRIPTSTGVFLDIAAQDFFGQGLLRNAGESDAAYAARIQASLFQEKATRAGMTKAITALVGVPPVIFEPRDPRDCGAYNSGTLGYGVSGGYGSMTLPFQCFITVLRPATGGVTGMVGYGMSPGGYGQGPIEYAGAADQTGVVSDDDIYATVASVAPCATIPWTKITSSLDSTDPYQLPAGNWDQSGWDQSSWGT